MNINYCNFLYISRNRYRKIYPAICSMQTYFYCPYKIILQSYSSIKKKIYIYICCRRISFPVTTVRETNLNAKYIVPTGDFHYVTPHHPSEAEFETVTSVQEVEYIYIIFLICLQHYSTKTACPLLIKVTATQAVFSVSHPKTNQLQLN